MRCLSRDAGYVDVDQGRDFCNGLLRVKHEGVFCGVVDLVLELVANPEKHDLPVPLRVRSSPGVEDS